jgi:hypothetical protein
MKYGEFAKQHGCHRCQHGSPPKSSPLLPKRCTSKAIPPSRSYDKLPLDEYIVLATPDKVLHLNFVMGNVCRHEIPYERLSPITTAGRNRGDQLVCEQLFSHRLFFLLDGRLHKVLDENSIQNLRSN